MSHVYTSVNEKNNDRSLA